MKIEIFLQIVSFPVFLKDTSICLHFQEGAIKCMCFGVCINRKEIGIEKEWSRLK